MGIQLHMTSKELGICVHVCWKTVSAGPNHKDLPGPWQIRGSSWREQGDLVRDISVVWKNWPSSSRATLQQDWVGWSGSTGLCKYFQAFLPCEENVRFSCEFAGMHFFGPKLSLGQCLSRKNAISGHGPWTGMCLRRNASGVLISAQDSLWLLTAFS